MNAVFLGVLAYIAVQLIVGVIVSRRVRTEEDFLVAGRRLGYWLGTATTFATWFGAETCIGSSGAVYESGLRGATADPFGYTCCLLLMGAVLAAPLRRRNLTTLADLFRQRYSHAVEWIAVLLIAPSSLLWAAAQVRAFGQVLAATSGMEVELALALATAVVLAYTAMGGMYSDAVTDLIQGAAIIIGLVLLTIMLSMHVGGVGAAVSRINPESLHFFSGVSRLELIEGWVVPVVGSVVAQELVSRVVSIRTPKMARNSCLLAGGIYLLVGLMPVGIGLVGASVFPGLGESDQALVSIAQRVLPVGLYVIFAGALLSAILSTVDSALLAASGLVVHNLLLPKFPHIPERAKLRLARLGVLVCGVLAYALAHSAEGVYELVEEASAFGGAGISLIVFAGLFTRFGGAKSGLWTVIAGLVVWLFASYVLKWEAPFLASLVASVLVYAAVGLWEGRSTGSATSSRVESPGQ